MGVEIELRNELYEMGDDVVSDSDLDYHIRSVLTNVSSVSVLQNAPKLKAILLYVLLLVVSEDLLTFCTMTTDS